ncbi:spore germination protein KB [Orenia metallireducens]|jgi:spore germination protein KB|uniref:Spore germination protein KB n=1 Tax=Orenia metallireducens TaxID=1413210 RepID=A0A285FJ60_9FIRM|nr:endospore germination permease [Orenia metallireducens]PRX33580.1 spore germination protein KB [Orenia metallireducens]SNY11300.1 spore germination protein KB [Orenia metallireducens]
MNKASTFNQLLEKGRVSNFQITLLVITLVIATADVLLPSFVAQQAQQDSWISVIIGTISGLVFINLYLILGLKHSDKTIVQYACDILGKPLGKIVGFMYIYFFFFNTAITARELQEILGLFFNIETSIFNLLIIAVAAYSIYGGLEVIARLNNMLLPLGMLTLVFIGVLNIPKMDFNYFLPVLFKGIVPPLRGALLIQTWLLKSIVLLQLIPFITKKEKLHRNISIATVLLGNALMVGVLLIAIFGPLTEHMIFPALGYVRVIRFGQYIEHIDAIIMLIWLTGIFINIAIYYYAAILGLAQLFSLKSYKPLITPGGILIICFSIIVAKNQTALLDFIHYIYPFYVSTIAIIIPAILLLISTIKNKNREDEVID